MGDPHEELHAALSGRYELLGEIGRGGMASVYLAHEVETEREVAIKVIHPELASGRGLRRFEREIGIATRLQHYNILPLLGSGTAGDLVYYITPWIEDDTLAARLQSGRPSIQETAAIACDVASALDYAHRMGVVHRDIKPHNILLSGSRAIVADFGIALITDATRETRLTETGTVLGTLHYISPEQLAGHRPIDGRADIYSLGCVIYEMLSGEPPFVGEWNEIVRQHLRAKPRPLRQLSPAPPRSLEAAVMRALSKDPRDRQPSALEFAASLSDHPESEGSRLGPTQRLGQKLKEIIRGDA